ncbi:MAG: hypothetical protein AB7J32_20575 [Pseudonocardia sp.]
MATTICTPPSPETSPASSSCPARTGWALRAEAAVLLARHEPAAELALRSAELFDRIGYVLEAAS